MVAAFVDVYKPVTTMGRPATSAGSLPHMPRGRCTAIKYLLDNLAVDGVAELATEFTSPNGTIKSFADFNARMRALVKASAVPPQEETWACGTSMFAPAPISVADQITYIIAALHDADADTLEAITADLANLRAMIDIVTASQRALALAIAA